MHLLIIVWYSKFVGFGPSWHRSVCEYEWCSLIMYLVQKAVLVFVVRVCLLCHIKTNVKSPQIINKHGTTIDVPRTWRATSTKYPQTHRIPFYYSLWIGCFAFLSQQWPSLSIVIFFLAMLLSYIRMSFALIADCEFRYFDWFLNMFESKFSFGDISAGLWDLALVKYRFGSVM